MVRNIFYKGKTAKTGNDITDIREIYGCIEVNYFHHKCPICDVVSSRVNSMLK